MPRPAQREVVTVEGPNGLIAAAVRLTGGNKTKKPKRAPSWYALAWQFYDTIGEYRYAVTWVGNLLSRATLEVHENGKPSKNPEALAAMASLFGGVEGQREMLRQLGTHLTVPGDAYIVGEDMGDAPDRWSIVAANRISQQGDGQTAIWKVGNTTLEDPLVIRIWRPHPQKQDEADSPSRAVLPILSEIDQLTKMVAAQVSSRLTGAGIMTLPSEISFGSVRGINDTGATTDTGIDAFLRELVETINTAVSDPTDASARTPIILQGPGEYIDKVNHLTFWSQLDEHAKELREENIRRLALGMDMPPEILTGTGDMNHWNSWQVEEASIKAHTEPLLQIITTSLTDAYLRPYLEASGMSEEEARAFTIYADTSKIRLRPNRSKEAIELYNEGALSMAAMVRENGFDPSDIMDDKERAAWLTKKVAGGSTTPELVAWALNILGVPIPAQALVVPEAQPTEARPDPSLQDHPTREIPVQDAIPAASVVVWRALERAGARLKSKHPGLLVPGGDRVTNDVVYRYANIPDDVIDDLLVGAWECTAALGITVPPTKMDAYARHLLMSNEPFSVDGFHRWMERQ